MDDLISRLRKPLSMSMFQSRDHMINALLSERTEAAAALEAAREDAARWHELCRQAEDGELPGGILEDAKHLGAGALEMHIDHSREARNE